MLEAEDVVYMKALEADDASAKTASVAKKKALRDAPAAKVYLMQIQSQSLKQHGILLY